MTGGVDFARRWGILLLLGLVLPQLLQPRIPIVPMRGFACRGSRIFEIWAATRRRTGRTVKPGLVYRSGELPRLTDEDLAKLEALGIKTVVNFLTEQEIKVHGRDRLPEGVTAIALPIAGGDIASGGLAAEILKARQTADFSGVPVELNAQIHRLLVTDAQQQYASLLRLVADPRNRPIVFHCSHGVHRTGTAAAILLAALGVPAATIERDYLLSNNYRQAEVNRRLGELRERAAKNQGITPQDVDMTNTRAFYILKPSYIRASLEEIEKEYRSLDHYLHHALGVTEQELSQLRDAMLTH